MILGAIQLQLCRTALPHVHVYYCSMYHCIHITVFDKSWNWQMSG